MKILRRDYGPKWLVKMKIFCNVPQHILPLLNHFPPFNSWLPPPPSLTVCYGGGVGELTAGKRRQLSKRLNLPFIYYACDSLYFKSEWNESDSGMVALDTSPSHLQPSQNQPYAICELSLSTQRHSHLCHTAQSLV